MHDGTKFMSAHGMGDSPKFWELKSCFLLMAHLGAKKRDLS